MEKIKYLDQSRYPKIAVEGYEKKFKDNYSKLVSLMGKDLINKMIQFIKTK